MELNILLRGQSNAELLQTSGVIDQIRQQIQSLLGFDGTTNTINLIGAAQTVPDANGNATEYGATSLLPSPTSIGNWLNVYSGGWQNGFTDAPLESALLAHLAALPAAVKAAPTIVLWMHDESDSTTPGLTAAEWAAAVRFDAAQVRAALGGQGAATVQYGFVSTIPFDSGLADSMQAIKTGMQNLASDPAFGGFVAAHIGDLDMNNPYNGLPDGDVIYGGPHMSTADLETIAGRLVNSLADRLAAYAVPGSPLATNGLVDGSGPQAVAASPAAANPDALLVTVKLDPASTGLQGPGSIAATGLGWTLRNAMGSLAATAVQVLGPTSLLVSFAQPVAALGAATLYYDYGTGRLAPGAAAYTGSLYPGVGAGSPGEGNALYDDKGMPIWADPAGLAVQRSAKFAGTLSAYTLSPASADAIHITGPGTDALFADGTDLAFADATVRVDLSGRAGDVARVFQAVLGRAPDTGALDFYTHLIDSGQASLTDIVGGIMSAPEVVARIGGKPLGDQAFLDQTYRNAMGRGVDQAGLQYWSGLLDAGTVSRPAALAFIALSNDGRAATEGAYGDAAEAEIQRQYQAAFGWAPAAGTNAWLTLPLRSQAMDSRDVTQALFTSTEFQAETAALSSADFIKTIYANALHRAPDAAGAATAQQGLDSGGLSRADFLYGITQSQEMMARTASTTHAGFVTLPSH